MLEWAASVASTHNSNVSSTQTKTTHQHYSIIMRPSLFQGVTFCCIIATLSNAASLPSKRDYITGSEEEVSKGLIKSRLLPLLILESFFPGHYARKAMLR